MDDLEEYANNIVKETWEKWCMFKNWEPGFNVFASRLCMNPKIMIISLNPGGDEESFKELCKQCEQGKFEAEKEPLLYTKDWPMAKTTKYIFGEHEQLLRNSVVMQLLFFRSKNMNKWQEGFTEMYCKDKREYIEKFCREKTVEIIRKIKPQSILLISFQVYDNLVCNKSFLPITLKDICYSKFTKKRQRNYQIAEWEQCPIFCTKHLSKLFSKENKLTVKDGFNKFLRDNNIM